MQDSIERNIALEGGVSRSGENNKNPLVGNQVSLRELFAAQDMRPIAATQAEELRKNILRAVFSPLN